MCARPTMHLSFPLPLLSGHRMPDTLGQAPQQVCRCEELRGILSDIQNEAEILRFVFLVLFLIFCFSFCDGCCDCSGTSLPLNFWALEKFGVIVRQLG